MIRLALLICLFPGRNVFAEGLVLDGPEFTATNISIVWNAPTNHWPTSLWVYKVVPQEFSSVAVSNLMAIGGFTMKDRSHIEGQRPDKRLLYFANRERTRHLGIVPMLGWAYYRDEKARDVGKERAKGVPSEAEALDLALKWLDKLRLSRDDLARRDDSSEFYVNRDVRERSWRDKTTGEHMKEVISRGVSFVRRVDGVDFTGIGSDAGFYVSFGSEARVADLELVWRNLKRDRRRTAASPEEILERIKRGKARMVPMTAVDLKNANSLTVDKAEPCYLGESGDTPQEFVYPFAALECTIEFQDRPKTRVAIKCPIISD
ncbi:MAG: hypothetical protein L0Y58_21665 [Verrucomicrobia subdivision 3 bacterium]|nr:hypothetical protein [Limisphaerales bacterium]